MNGLLHYILELRHQRDKWRRRFYEMRASRDLWKHRALNRKRI